MLNLKTRGLPGAGEALWAESLPPLDVPKWTIQCYFKWFWPHVTLLVIFLKPAIRLSSALTPFLQSHTQNMSREAMPVDTVCGLGSQPLPQVRPSPLLPTKPRRAHDTAAQTTANVGWAPHMPHGRTSRQPTSQRPAGPHSARGLSEQGTRHLLRPPESWPGLRLREASES